MKSLLIILLAFLLTSCSQHQNDDFTAGDKNEIDLENGGTIQITAMTHHMLATPCVEANYWAPETDYYSEEIGFWSGTDLQPEVHISTNSLAVISPDRQTIFVRTDKYVWDFNHGLRDVSSRENIRIWNSYTMLFPDKHFSLGMDHYRSFTRLSEADLTRIHDALHTGFMKNKPTATIQHFDPDTQEVLVQVQSGSANTLNLTLKLAADGAALRLDRLEAK